MWNAENTSPEVEGSGSDIAILPVGAIEQHGSHLPLGTDWMEADAVAHRVSEVLGAYLLPALPFSNSQAHARFRGTVSLQPETLAVVVKDLVSSLFAQGFKRVVLVNLHGGNAILKIAVRELNYLHSEGKVILVSPWIPAAAELHVLFPDLDNDLHAGDLETSLMLAIDANLVRADRSDYVPQGLSGEFFDYLDISALTESGVWGKPSQASPEKGKAALDLMVEKTVQYIRRTFRQIDER
jgi:creatinine amidohydrolase